LAGTDGCSVRTVGDFGNLFVPLGGRFGVFPTTGQDRTGTSDLGTFLPESLTS